MNRCELFEDEGVLKLERGVPLESHFDECADCLDARRAYDYLIRELGRLDAETEPSPAWQAGVWSRLAEERDRPTRQWSRWLMPAGAIAAAAALIVAVWLGRTPEALSLTAEVHAGRTPVQRGADAHRGDELRVSATIAGQPHAHLRVYFNDSELVADCVAGVSCTRQGDGISMTVALSSVGTYRPVLVVSGGTIPPATGTLDRDAAAAIAASAQIKAGDPVAVR